MNSVLSIGWPTVFAIAILGTALTFVGLKGFKNIRDDKRDGFGARPTERLAFVVLNGIIFIFAALIVTLLKLSIRG